MSSSTSPSGEPSDLSDLLRRVVAGDEEARSTFFDVYAPLVLKFVDFTFGLDHDEADDVVQETMIAGLRAVSSYDGSTKVTTWLFGIARHKAIDFLRAPVRAEVPWSRLGLEVPRAAPAEPDAGKASEGDEGGRVPEEIEAALGDAAVDGDELGEADGTSGLLLPDTGSSTATAAPPSPAAGGSEPFRTWAWEIATWLATQPEETRIIARRFTHEASYDHLACDLADCLGEPVNETAVRKRVSRFKQAFKDRFQHLLPSSRVRPSDE